MFILTITRTKANAADVADGNVLKPDGDKVTATTDLLATPILEYTVSGDFTLEPLGITAAIKVGSKVDANGGTVKTLVSGDQVEVFDYDRKSPGFSGNFIAFYDIA